MEKENLFTSGSEQIYIIISDKLWQWKGQKQNKNRKKKKNKVSWLKKKKGVGDRERPSQFNGPLSPMNEPSQARVPTEIGPVAGTKKQPVNRPGELLFLRSHPIAVCKSFIFYIYNSFLGVSSKKRLFFVLISPRVRDN